jgi:hypothetical protein
VKHDRSQIARQAAKGLRHFAAARQEHPILLGFDGFVDSIIAVVDKRHDADHFEPVPTIEQFGRKVLVAAGQSSNYELVVRLQKLGGNGPIMANAMAALGLGVTYIGSLGLPQVHPVFNDFCKRATCYSIAEPGLTDALEFQDGKLMLGKHQSLRNICWQQILDVVGLDRLRELVARGSLIAMVNWTMLPRLSEVWRQLIDNVLCNTEQLHATSTPTDEAAGRDQGKPRGQNSGSRKRIFIDLADPEKRTWSDLRDALRLCSEFQKYADVMLGLNLKESVQVAAALDIDVPDRPKDAIELLARRIREELEVRTVVIHPRAAAAACTMNDDEESSAVFAGPFVANPRISTGAGDNFNAGFCLGQLAGLTISESLCAATALSGYYVREARSPTLEELIDFVHDLPPPE